MAEMTEKGALRMGVEVEEEEGGELEEGEIREVALPRQPKHLLEKSWTFWFDSPNGKARQTTWGASLRAIYTFHSVEDFWGLYNNILPPSLLASGIDFYCFKAGIEPKWEDPYCAYGGRWTVSTARARNPFMDTFWLYTILAMIGEQFDDGDEICGAVINIRVKQEKLSIWTKTASNEAAQMSIGRQWKELLDYREKVSFYVHEDSKRQDKQPKSRYVVE